jgi:Protein of unknown function (DUF3040)
MAMSLSAREQQELASIEDRLASSDPKLASLLAMFGRLASGEDMPMRDKVRMLGRRASPGRHRYQKRARRTGASRLVRGVCRRPGWPWIALCVLVSVGLIAAALV